MNNPDQWRTEEFFDICVITPTYNRLPLLKRLYSSLIDQDDLQFTWVIVDDASSDATREWATEIAICAPFPITVLSNHQNVGKGRSLNHAFDSHSAELAVIVDSDDQLLPTAISGIRSRLAGVVAMEEIGALFFSYVDASGQKLGEPPNGKDVLTTRALMDSKHGKYDGCVAYTGKVLEHYRYPEFTGENYIAPTVLQLLMSPPFKILFCSLTVGTAHYQADGLTNSGRGLRLRNPCGMMMYSALNARNGSGWIFKLKYRISYWAYASSINSLPVPNQISPPRDCFIEVIAGRLLARYWRWRATGSFSS